MHALNILLKQGFNMMLYNILFSALDNLLSKIVIQGTVLYAFVSEMISSCENFLMAANFMLFILGPCYPVEIHLTQG